MNKIDAEISKKFSGYDGVWKGNSGTIALGSMLSVYRNLAPYKFLAKLGADERSKILGSCEKAFAVATAKKGLSAHADALSPEAKAYLFEHFLLPQSFQQAGSNEGVGLDGDARLLWLINVSEHIALHKLAAGADIEALWAQLGPVEAALSSALLFQYSDRFGYLTQDIRHAGTGLVAEIFLHLPALVRAGKVTSSLPQGIVASGMQMEEGKYPADVVRIRNPLSLGSSEESLLTSVSTAASILIKAEEQQRKDLHLDDAIARALGSCKFAHEMDLSEALSALSLIKLGAQLGKIQGLSQEACNYMLFGVKRAHLVSELGTVSPEELSGKRASWLRQQLQAAVAA